METRTRTAIGALRLPLGGALLGLIALSALYLTPRSSVPAAIAQPAPRITLSPAEGPSGTAVTVAGLGFAAGQQVKLYWSGSGAAMPTATSSNRGVFSAELTAPAAPAGSYTVSVDVDGTIASAEYTVTGQDAPTPAPALERKADSSSREAGNGSSRRVVAYFPLWIRNSGYTERDVDFSIVTQVAHFSVVPRADGSIEIPDWGPFPDPALINRAHAAGAKVSLVVGGDQAAATQGFSAMAANAGTRGIFVRNLMSLVTASGYDGVDIDWEFPESDADRANMTALLADLRAALGPNRTLSIAAPSSDWYGRWLDLEAITPYLDWVGAMTYDMHGPGWSDHAGHNSGLYASSADNQFHWGGEITIDSSKGYYLSRGVPAEKLLIGLPFYGKRFDGASDMNQRLSSSSGAALDYRDLAGMIGNGWKVQRDNTAQVPYLVGESGGVVTYDDPSSISAKCNYAVDEGLGGVILWHLGKDGSGANQPLLEAVRECR